MHLSECRLFIVNRSVPSIFLFCYIVPVNNMTQKKPFLILGLGNNILSDDGIGPRLVRELATAIADPRIDFETCACGGLEIMESISGYQKVIFIDAIRTAGGKAGSIYHFTPEDFRETSNLSNQHDINFLTALRLGNLLGLKLPAFIHIIAIEIAEDMIFSEEFTPEVRKRFPDIVAETVGIINRLIN